MGNINADGGAAVDGLYHHGKLRLGGQLLQVLLAHSDHLPAGGNDLVGHHALGQVLVHGNGRGQIARSGIGHAQQIQGSLDAAILPAGAVKGQVYNIRPGTQLQHPGANGGGALILAAGAHLLQVRGLTGDLLKGLRDRLTVQALRRARHSLQAKKQIHQSHLVSALPKRLTHHGAGGQRDITFRAQTAGQYHYLHFDTPHYRPYGHTYHILYANGSF